MKNDDEMYQSLLSRYEQYQTKRSRRIRTVKRSAPVIASFCFAAVIGFGWWGRANREPDVIVVPDIVDVPSTVTTAASVSTAEAARTTLNSRTTAATASAAHTDKAVTAAVQSTIPQTSGRQPQTQIPPVTQQIMPTDPVTQPVTPAVTVTATAVQTTAADVQTETVVTAPVTTETPGGNDMAVHHSTATTAESGDSQKPIEGPSVRNWEDLPLPDKYPQARINGNCVYSVTWSTVSEDMIDSFLGDAYMVGVYDGMEYHCSAKAYLVQGFSDSMAVAIRFDDDDKYNLYKFIYEE